MRKADPASVGRRVKERREELGLSQKELGDESGYSQQNIANIESGGVKRPERFAAALSMALRTTMDWLLYETGPREYGPQFFSDKKLVENFSLLPAEVKEAFSEQIDAAVKKAQRKKPSTSA